MDIPRCDSANDFKSGKYITVAMGTDIVFYIWQHKDSDSDYVRYSTTGYIAGAAPTIPGEPSAGGNKGLAFFADGSTTKLMMTTYS
jgi:hypothetical protein